MFALVTFLATGLACSSGPEEQIDPFEMAGEDREEDLLDQQPEPTEDHERTRADDQDDEPMVVPQAAAEPARPVNARPDGWDMSDRRVFDDADHVYEGASRWDGPDDASFAAAVDTDDSHVYFWIEVTDDRVVDSRPTHPLDGVEIRLRDPRLDNLLAALPPTLRDRLDVEIEAGYAITPDGRTAPTDGDESVPPEALHSAAIDTDEGYVIEAAFALEALPYLAEIPLDEIAFRIDVLDADPGDDTPSSRLSAIIDADGSPHFAVTDTDGMLPAASPEQRPPRADALGMWHRTGDGWIFETLEYVSNRWNLVDDFEGVADRLLELGAFPDVCDDVDAQHRIHDVYDYRDGSHRIVLSSCGPAADNGCSDEARSQVVWTHLERDRDRWLMAESQTVFDQPLEQCVHTAPEGQPLHHDFSLMPFDRVANRMWAVDYRRSLEGTNHEVDERELRLVDPRSEQFVQLDRRLQSVRDSGRERVLRDNRIYLTDLEDDGNLDVCKVEEIKEQTCESFQSGCETIPRGHEVIPNIDLWDAEDHRFEDFLLTRHDDCRGSTQFEDIGSGYKILTVGDRIGLLPTRD